MPLKEVLYKIKGMQRDNSESVFNPEFAYENMNMRIEASKNNNLLSMHNEIGNKVLEILDALNNIIDNNILGIPIGYTVLDDYAIIFTTDTTHDTGNYDEVDINNYKNTYKINSILYSNLTATALFLNLDIAETGITLLDKLSINLTVSFVRKLNDTDHYEAPITLENLIGIKTLNTNEYQFNLPDTYTYYNKSVAIIINNIKVSYKLNNLLSYPVNIFMNIATPDVITLTGLQNIVFPTYTESSTSLLDAEIVTGNAPTLNGINVVGGNLDIYEGNYNSFNIDYSIHNNGIKYYQYNYITHIYDLNNTYTDGTLFVDTAITNYSNGLVLVDFYPIVLVTGFIIKYTDLLYLRYYTLLVGQSIPIYLALNGILVVEVYFTPSDVNNRNLIITSNGANIQVLQTMQKGTSPVWITVKVTGSGYITITSVLNPSISRLILFNKLNY